MAPDADELWNRFQLLKKDIETLLNDRTDSDLPRSLADTRARQAPGLEEYVALQERLCNLRGYLQDFVNKVKEMDPAKTQLLESLKTLQDQVNNAPSKTDLDAAKDKLKQWDVSWAKIKPELEQLRGQKNEMNESIEDFKSKEAEYERLKNNEAVVNSDHDELVTLRAKQDEYNRLKGIEARLNTNDDEYKALLRKSNDLNSATNELAQLRARSQAMEDDAAELARLRARAQDMERDSNELAQLRTRSQAMEDGAAELVRLRAQAQDMERDSNELEQLRNRQQEWSNRSTIEGPTESTAPVDAPEPPSPVALAQAAIRVQADLHDRFINEIVTESALELSIASHAASTGAQAYVNAVAVGQSEVDALEAAREAAHDLQETARLAGEAAYTNAKDRQRSSPVARIGSNTAIRQVLLGRSHDEAQFVARQAVRDAETPEQQTTPADQTAQTAPTAVSGAANAPGATTAASGATAAAPGATTTAPGATAAAVPAAAPGAAGTTLTAAQLQTALNITTPQTQRSPWQIYQGIANGGIKVGDGTTPYSNYPNLPASLTQAVVDRLAQDFVNYFCELPAAECDKQFTGTMRVTNCLYRRSKSQGAGTGAPEFACGTCVTGNRICVRREGTRNGVVFIAPLPVANRPAGAVPANLDYWVTNPTAAMQRP